MNPTLAWANPIVSPPYRYASFQVGRSHELPHYYQLSLRDRAGADAYWIIPFSIKHVAKRSVVVWRLPSEHALGWLAPIDAGALQLAACQAGTEASPTLAVGLARGVLRLRFQGQLLQGYFRLQCLPQGGGQLWQLIPIGHV